MTVRINKPALNLREELTKAQGVVRYEQRQFWMDGLVENGTFDNGTTGWTVYSGFLSNVGGVARLTEDGGDGVTARAYQLIPTQVGKKYVAKATFSNVTTGTAVLTISDSYTVLGGKPNATSSGGDVQLVFTADADNTYLVISTSGATSRSFDFDNVAVFEVDENDEVIHSLPLGFKPLHVYEDGLIQREGDVHDYTVVKTGGAYAIKPTVAPSATTETCVIAEREL